DKVLSAGFRAAARRFRFRATARLTTLLASGSRARARTKCTYKEPANSRLLLSGIFERGAGCFDQLGLALERGGGARNLRFRFFPILAVHGFQNSGQWLGFVSGIRAWSIDLVLEPWTAGETARIGQ